MCIIFIYFTFKQETCIMACFIVPATEAVVTAAVNHFVKKKEKKEESVKLGFDAEKDTKTPFSKKLGILNKMLWGGSALLAFEHLWHGEITPFFPFLTAAADKDSAVTMLKEMATVGTSMAFLVTGVWLVMLAIWNTLEKKSEKAKEKV